MIQWERKQGLLLLPSGTFFVNDYLLVVVIIVVVVVVAAVVVVVVCVCVCARARVCVLVCVSYPKLATLKVHLPSKKIIETLEKVCFLQLYQQQTF